MRSDAYLRAVLTVIAAALVYLCVVLTPVTGVSAQGRVGTPVPGVPTGPAEMVIVGWRTPAGEAVPVQVVGGQVQVPNEVRVIGRVESVQPERAATRTVIVGYEEGATESPAPGRGYQPGQFRGLGPTSRLPVDAR